LVAPWIRVDPGPNCPLFSDEAASGIDDYFIEYFFDLLVSTKESIEEIETLFKGKLFV
jgi:hypothetical protein